MTIPSVGIRAIDVYLPDTVRKREDWPKDTVERWLSRKPTFAPGNDIDGLTMTEGVRKALAANAAASSDPFTGCEEARIIDKNDEPSDLEARAAKKVLERAGVSADEIDLLLSYPMIPDVLTVNPAAVVHEKVGLRRDILAYGVQGVCASFMLQMDIARRYIQTGGAKLAMLTQSAACTRVMPEEAPYSPWFGDGGAAAIVGEVEPGFGLLHVKQRTWGEYHRAFCCNVPGGRWYEGKGRIIACNDDRAAARKSFVEAFDVAKDIIADALSEAGLSHGDVSFFACHQPTGWFMPLCQEHSGLAAAKSIQTFSWTGSLTAVNIPLQLSLGCHEGMLKKGDIVVAFTVASGMTATAAVMRWAYDAGAKAPARAL